MIQKIAKIVRDEDRFLLVTHVNPDGDAVGSLLGLHLALKEMGKKSWPVAGEQFPELYDFLPGRDSLVTNVSLLNDPPNWIVSLDVASEERISGDITRFRDRAQLVNIDHHPTNPGFGDLNFLVPSATSTAELVYKVIKEAGCKLSADVGKCLYAGLVTDTGCFRFSGVNSETLLLGAEMLGAGFDSFEVTRYLYEEYPLRRLRLEQLVFERIEILVGGRLVLSTLYHTDFEGLGAHMSESENLVNRLRECRGVEVGALITEMPDKVMRMSFRSKGSVDVSAVAKSIGGGGHRHAAGARSTLPLPQLKKKIVQAVEAALS
jgi:phosphoesterase RecJ-like protein